MEREANPAVRWFFLLLANHNISQLERCEVKQHNVNQVDRQADSRQTGRPQIAQPLLCFVSPQTSDELKKNIPAFQTAVNAPEGPFGEGWVLRM